MIDQSFGDLVLGWILNNGISALFVLVIGLLVLKFMKRPIEAVIRAMIPADTFPSPEAEKKREDTLIQVVMGTAKIVIWVITILMIFTELGIPILPLLAGVGVLGLAISFGAQYVVRDIVTGVFIVMENQFRVGDVIDINGISGVVEDMSLRITKIRGVDGTVHFIPNGEVKVASNKTKDFSKINLKIGVAYDTDIDKVERVINELGEEMAKDEAFEDMIVEAPKFERITDFGPYEINIKITGTVKPKRQWKVSGEIQRRIKVAFEKNGIEIPYPQQVIHYAKEK